jgi:heat shock protein HtpX
MTAVLAHEIGHILNGDAQLLSLAAELNQMIINAVMAIVLNELGGRARAIGGGRMHPVSTLLIVIAAPFVSALLQHGLSRAREYDADRLAACLMGQPFWLVGALRKLNAETTGGRYAPPSLSAGVGMLMRSHPDVGERIERLASLVQTRR